MQYGKVVASLGAVEEVGILQWHERAGRRCADAEPRTGLMMALYALFSELSFLGLHSEELVL